MTRPITRYDVKSIIKEFKSRKAPGISGVSKEILYIEDSRSSNRQICRNHKSGLLPSNLQERINPHD